MHRLTIAAFALLAACDGSPLFASEGAFDDADNGAEGAADTAQSDSAGEEFAPPAWYTFAARLAMLEGEATVEGAEGRVVLASAELDRQDCEALPAAAVSVAALPAVDDELFGWWTFDLDELTGCEVVGLPQTLGVGIGELNAEVRARLGTVDREGDADDLFGAWLSDDGGTTVFPFGYADGGEVTARDGAPVNAEFVLEPLLLLALPPA
jgi:hypothetical protein